MNKLLAAALITAALLSAQPRNPVQWTATADPAIVAPGSATLARIAAKIDPGWHIYALTSPAGGPTPTTVKLGETTVASGHKLYQSKPAVKFDPEFNITVQAFEGEVKLVASVAIPENARDGPAEIPLLLRYHACTDKECLPRKATVNLNLKIDPK